MSARAISEKTCCKVNEMPLLGNQSSVASHLRKNMLIYIYIYIYIYIQKQLLPGIVMSSCIFITIIVRGYELKRTKSDKQ